MEPRAGVCRLLLELTGPDPSSSCSSDFQGLASTLCCPVEREIVLQTIVMEEFCFAAGISMCP